MAELLDADGPDTRRLTVTEAAALSTAALKRLGYSDDDAAVITGQLVDNALFGVAPIREDVASERVRALLRQLDRLVEPLVLDDRQDGAEDLVFHDLVIHRHAVDHRRGDEDQQYAEPGRRHDCEL